MKSSLILETKDGTTVCALISTGYYLVTCHLYTELGVIMKFKDEEDLKVYQDAAPHRAYQANTAAQTAGTQ